jgi:hypothetical protein
MIIIHRLGYLWLFVLATGCATSYKPVTTSLYPYRNKSSVNEQIAISYDYDVQHMSNNKRYSNSEKKNSLAAVAVRVENKSDQAIIITRESLLIFKTDIQVQPIAPLEYTKRVKQKGGFHLFHALWGPWAFSYSTNSTGQTDTKFFYLPVGAIIGLGNAIKASNANALHLATLQSNEIWGKQVLPGEKVYGIILIRAFGFEELRFEFVE